jgi:23S rRNA (guanine745-N1)-methyltransferase
VLADVLRFLACPLCGQGLTQRGGALACPAGHSFDVARQGYVNLVPGGASVAGGDTAEMVSARDGFLAAGHFAPIAAALADAAARACASAGGDGCDGGGDRCVADAGAGTGYYLAAVLNGLPGKRAGLALDASRAALRRAARAHPRIGAVGCDVWRGLPVADGAAAVVLNVFAPRNGAEYRRVLDGGGRLLVVTPNPDHLREQVTALGLLTVDEGKPGRLARSLEPWFRPDGSEDISATAPLSHSDVKAAVLMGPSAWQAAERGSLARIASLPGILPVTVSVTLSRWIAR